MLEALQHVAYHEDRSTREKTDRTGAHTRSVGLSYEEIERRLVDMGKVTRHTIRSYARDAKAEGRLLPDRRPNSGTGKGKAQEGRRGNGKEWE